MKWIYLHTKAWEVEKIAAQKTYLRAVGEETEEGLRVSDILEINTFAMDFYFGLDDNPMASPKYQEIYYKELEEKAYFIEEVELTDSQSEYMMKSVVLYLKAPFSKEELHNWFKTYLTILGLECSTFEERGQNFFYEMYPILRLFSEENVKQLEGKLGKEWWKRNEEE